MYEAYTSEQQGGRQVKTPFIETAAVILTAGRKDKRRMEDFNLMLSSFNKLSVAPDMFVLCLDWGADPEYAETFQNANGSFPTKVISRPPPQDNTILYPRHFYEVHLKLVWWWTINTAFVTTRARQICFFDDDVAIHPDFFAWCKEIRLKIPRNKYWGLYATGGTPYMPLCMNQFEWSLVLYYHQDFCLKEQGSWDIVLFGLHQNGPISENRARTATRSAIHLSYSKGNVTEKALQMNNVFSQKLALDQYRLETPYYPGYTEPAKLVDLNFKDLHEPKNRASTQSQLLKMIEYCTSVALNAKSELSVAEKLIPLHRYNKTRGVNVDGYTLASFKDRDIHLNQSMNICNKNADCMGFLHTSRTNESVFKSNVSTTLIRDTIDKSMILYTKECERISARNLCIPAHTYVD